MNNSTFKNLWKSLLTGALLVLVWSAHGAAFTGGTGGGSQTPWFQDESASGYGLSGLGRFAMTNATSEIQQILTGTNTICYIIVTNAAGVRVTNTMVIGDLSTTNAFEWSGTNGLRNAFLDQLGNFNGTSFAANSVTTANLPVSPTGARAFASDAITPTGVGGDVWFDGSNWRLSGYNIIAVADIPRFITNCAEASLPFSSRLSDFRIEQEEYSPISLNFVRNGTSAGTGAGLGQYNVFTGYGNSGYFLTGTTTTGNAYGYGQQVPAVAANYYYGCGGNYFVSQLATTADGYWALVGMSSAPSAVYPTDGEFFLYDQNTNFDVTFISGLVGAAKTATNNWICVSAKASVYTYIDSGLPATISTSSPNRLGVVYTNGAALYYTNGALSQTITANQTVQIMYLNRAVITKTAGTTACYLAEQLPWRFIRHPVRVFP